MNVLSNGITTGRDTLDKKNHSFGLVCFGCGQNEPIRGFLFGYGMSHGPADGGGRGSGTGNGWGEGSGKAVVMEQVIILNS